MTTPNTNSPTPMTDAEEVFRPNYEGQGVGWVKSAVARQLETKLQSALREVKELKEIKAWQASTIDHLLAHCGDSECSECAKFVCPHKEPLHFHHDGCPSCFSFERLEQEVEELKREMETLEGWLASEIGIEEGERNAGDDPSKRYWIGADNQVYESRRQAIDNAMKEEK